MCLIITTASWKSLENLARWMLKPSSQSSDLHFQRDLKKNLMLWLSNSGMLRKLQELFVRTKSKLCFNWSYIFFFSNLLYFDVNLSFLWWKVWGQLGTGKLINKNEEIWKIIVNYLIIIGLVQFLWFSFIINLYVQIWGLTIFLWFKTLDVQFVWWRL